MTKTKKSFSKGSIREDLQERYADIINDRNTPSLAYRGHTYYLWSLTTDKTAARKRADMIRKHGFSTFIFSGISEYGIFVRLKKK